MAAMAFPCRLEAGLGRFRPPTEEEEIAQSVRLILGTRRGERPFRPEFGTRLDQFAFESADTTTRSLIRQEVVSALQSWEPRICKIEVSFEPAQEDGVLLAQVSYQIRQTGGAGQQSLRLPTTA